MYLMCSKHDLQSDPVACYWYIHVIEVFMEVTVIYDLKHIDHQINFNNINSSQHLVFNIINHNKEIRPMVDMKIDIKRLR